MLAKFIDKIVSRKLFVWGVGTVAFFMHFMTPMEWIALSGVYLGAQALVDTLKK
jgi:hypothetical protein